MLSLHQLCYHTWMRNKGFDKKVFCYRWIEVDYIKADERMVVFVRYVLIPFEHCLGIFPLIHACSFYDFLVDSFQDFFANDSDFRFRWVYKATCGAVLKVRFMIFKVMNASFLASASILLSRPRFSAICFSFEMISCTLFGGAFLYDLVVFASRSCLYEFVSIR